MQQLLWLLNLNYTINTTIKKPQLAVPLTLAIEFGVNTTNMQIKPMKRERNRFFNVFMTSVHLMFSILQFEQEIPLSQVKMTIQRMCACSHFRVNEVELHCVLKI